ncbi:hypothetical protein HN371_22540 [Candidatus Poribacteria bacterium]|jgi:predicted GH43/DUF377 family glycosyl hydrolase|nr:hypothetical protein [Candidatus Poribacteria bacterium]MBT5536858.1 hypothetical protein [Candidatus Poribacteria bacterium]MBT5713296.1 hypothetical protein [Candidatus Poribacteria bacterium]MBT7098580.1 hypothetical protein [Candidatus Poribacteria bacterium]MBT7804292.1 hypothetical protein [Candidatus Poribacteria bacterium]
MHRLPRMGAARRTLLAVAALLSVFATSMYAQTEWSKLSPVQDLAGHDFSVGGAGTSVLRENGLYRIWYSEHSGGANHHIAYATSTDGITWEKHGAVLRQGSWDRQSMYAPCVVNDAGTYKMWYSGHNGRGGHFDIGYATSPDGVAWTKYPSDSPVYRDADVSDGQELHLGSVLRVGDVYHMWLDTWPGVTGTRDIRYATSLNGINWTDRGMVLGTGPHAWDSAQVAWPAVVSRDGLFEMFYVGYDGQGDTAIGYATSTDGMEWRKLDQDLPDGVPALSRGTGFDSEAVGLPTVLLDGSTYEMWYSASDGSARVGYAISTSDDAAPTPGQAWESVAPTQAAFRNSAWSVEVGGLIYTGQGSDPLGNGTMERYDPRTDSWVWLPMSTDIYVRAAAVVAGRIYAFGGNTHGGPLSWAEVFDPAGDSWADISRMPTARNSPAAAAVDGWIYVTGGNVWSRNEGLTVNEAYNVATGRWETRAPMLRPRAKHGSVAINGRVYVVGGEPAAGSYTMVDVYDPSSDSWSTIPDVLSSPRIALGVSTDGRRIYAVGGWNPVTRETEATVDVFDVVTNERAVLPPMGVARTETTAVVTGGHLYVVGGGSTDVVERIAVSPGAIAHQRRTSFTVSLHTGVNLVHVPVKVDGLDNASDLFEALGGSDDVGLIVMLDDAGKFVAFTSDVEPGSPADVALTDSSGAIVVMKRSKAVSFGGGLLATDVALNQGINVIGVPRDGAVATVGEIADLSGDVQRVIREENGRFVAVVSDATDADVTGGAAYIVLARADTTLALDGEAWENAPTAAPTTNIAYNTDASPVFLVEGSLMREDTLDVVNGIDVTVTNMRTGDALTDTAGRSGAGRFATTFLSLGGAEYRVGDTFELRVLDPSGVFGGVRRTQFSITREDMRNGRIGLGALRVSVAPERSALLPNYPNPFNPETWFPYRLSESSDVAIAIYDTPGRVVRRLDLGSRPAGLYESRARAAHWDGRNTLGEAVSSGTYVVELRAGSYRAIRRIVIAR